MAKIGSDGNISERAVTNDGGLHFATAMEGGWLDFGRDWANAMSGRTNTAEAYLPKVDGLERTRANMGAIAMAFDKSDVSENSRATAFDNVFGGEGKVLAQSVNTSLTGQKKEIRNS